MAGIAALKAHLNKSSCKEKLSTLGDVEAFLRRGYPTLSVESANIDEKEWLIVRCVKYVELIGSNNNTVGPVKPARIVFSSNGTYSFEVLFKNIHSDSWISSEPPHAQLTSLLDTLLAHSRYCLCPGIRSYDSEFADTIHFKSKNLRVWSHPVVRHDSSLCLLWHRPHNSHARSNLSLFNLCRNCKSLQHDLVAIKKRIAATLPEDGTIKLTQSSSTGVEGQTNKLENYTKQY